MLSYNETPIQEIRDQRLDEFGVRLYIKREDLNHPYVSGNKWWKLKHNLLEAKRGEHKVLLTFGGAYSNHIYATAAAAKEEGFNCIGIIRGEETMPLNKTLSFARSCGMQIHYVSREIYRRKMDESFLSSLREKFGRFYFIPEGGTNAFAIMGVKEFADSLSSIAFDYRCVPVGTGGTLVGLIQGLNGLRNIIGYSVLKDGEFLKGEVRQLLKLTHHNDPGNWQLITNYHHGGYGKVSGELLTFLTDFEKQHGFSLDPIYTGKMMWGIFEDVRRGNFRKGSTILALHTGGLQGWNGFR